MASRLIAAIIAKLNSTLNADGAGSGTGLFGVLPSNPIPSGGSADPQGLMGALYDTIMPDVIQPLGAAPSGNVVYNTIPVSPQIWRILIPAAYLVAASGGPWTLTLGTGSGATVVVPIIQAGDTLLSGDLLFSVYVDASGNVRDDFWQIVASAAAGGTYYKQSDGTMMAQYQDPTIRTTNLASGAIFTTGVIAYMFPAAFIGPPRVFPGMDAATAGPVWATGTSSATTATQVTLQLLGVSITSSGRLDYYALGQWR
jgi:hypothetical protein